MATADPWGAFPDAPAASPTGFIPGTGKTPPAQTPEQIEANKLDVKLKQKQLGTTYHTLSPEEIKAGSLPPGVYQRTSEGKIDKVADAPATDQALSGAIRDLGLDELRGNIANARKLLRTKDTFLGLPIAGATGPMAQVARHAWGSVANDFSGALDSIKGANIMEKLQALKEASKTGASGMGALSEREGDRMAASIAPLNPDMSREELEKALDIADRHAAALQSIQRQAEGRATAPEKGWMTLPSGLRIRRVK